MSDTWVVRLPTWLGDTIMALPVVRAAARAAQGRLILWGPPGRDELLGLAGLAFDYLPYRRRRGLAGIRDAVDAIGELRHREPDAALLLPNAFEPALLARAAGVPRRIGFRTDGRGPLLTDPVAEPMPRHAVHEADRFARLAEHLGWTLRPDDHLMPPSAELAQRGAVLFPEAPPEAPREAPPEAPRQVTSESPPQPTPEPNAYLGIVAGSANAPAKRWAAGAYAEVADLAHARWGALPVLLGSVADADVNHRIAARMSAPVIDLSGCDLIDLAAALIRCRAVVSNDTGAAHLAAALGRPTAVLFGPTDPARSGPRGPRVLNLSARLFCRSCRSGHCDLEHRGMAELAVDDVFESLATFWQGDA